MNSTICLFNVIQINDLNYLSLRTGPPQYDLLFDEWVDHVVKELNVEEALKSPILVVQKAAAPKTGVEFCQGSIGTIKSSLATLYDV